MAIYTSYIPSQTTFHQPVIKPWGRRLSMSTCCMMAGRRPERRRGELTGEIDIKLQNLDDPSCSWWWFQVQADDNSKWKSTFCSLAGSISRPLVPTRGARRPRTNVISTVALCTRAVPRTKLSPPPPYRYSINHQGPPHYHHYHHHPHTRSLTIIKLLLTIITITIILIDNWFCTHVDDVTGPKDIREDHKNLV